MKIIQPFLLKRAHKEAREKSADFKLATTEAIHDFEAGTNVESAALYSTNSAKHF